LSDSSSAGYHGLGQRGLPFDEPREEPDKQEVGERPKLIEILETVSAYDSDIRYFADQCRWGMNEAT
jgi:hypothetical protein